MACVAEGSALDLEEALMAAMAGEMALADKALDTAFAEGANAVQVVRGGAAACAAAAPGGAGGGRGCGPGGALDGLRPPVFFRHKPAFERALRLWRPEALEAAGAALLEAERRTKTTGLSRRGRSPACRDGALARQAAAAARLISCPGAGG